MPLDITPAVKPLDTQWSSVSTVASQPIWSRSVKDELASLTGLPTNWDSYGSPPVRNEVVTIALDVLATLSKFNMERPHVVPIHGGGVQFEWASQTSELELEIRPTGSIEFLIVDEQEKTFEGPIENPDSSKLFSLSNWFLSEAKSVDDLRLVAHASTY